MSARDALPFSEGQVDTLLRSFENAGCVLIGVSGGPDSIALLLMASEWAARRGKARIAAATVDHGLRPEAPAEAEAVAKLCARLGVPHATLAWVGPKPATRMQELAREARYRLLAGHARTIGAGAIATAHHAGDQAETVLFRLVRGSGIAGLRGMDAASERDGLTHFRPLLGVAKTDLVAFCEARGEPYAKDPSNADPRYARVRLRGLLGRLDSEGLDTQRLLRLARRAAEADDALAQAVNDVEQRLGAGALDARALFSEPTAIVHRVLLRRIAAAGGRDASRIGLEKIEVLTALLREALKDGRGHAANVGGALVRLTALGELRFGPEPPRTPRGPRRDRSSDSAPNSPKTGLT